MATAILAACALVAAATASDATDWRAIEVEACDVRYHRGHAALARQVARSTGAILTRLNTDLGLALRRSVRVWLTATDEEYRRRVGVGAPAWSSAMALLDRGEVVVRAERLGAALPGTLTETLRHELCHLVLHEAERGFEQGLPLWFHEGVATYLSGARHFQDGRPFILAAAQGALIPLRRLRSGFPRRRDAARLAYLQSEDFIAFVVGEHSRSSLRWWLDAYRRTGDFEAAAREALGESLASLEHRWRERYRARFPWLRILWEATTLFGALAMATVLVYLVRRARARRIRLEWEREDWRLGRPLDDAGDWGDPDDEDAEP